MLLDRKKYVESGYILEEAFANDRDEKFHKYAIVEQTIADGDFSMEEALEAYQVTRKDFENFLAKKYNFQIKASFSGAPKQSASIMYLHILNYMLSDFFEPRFKNRLKSIQKELNQLSHEIKREKENV